MRKNGVSFLENLVGHQNLKARGAKRKIANPPEVNRLTAVGVFLGIG
jgi:hypothetical protein